MAFKLVLLLASLPVVNSFRCYQCASVEMSQQGNWIQTGLPNKVAVVHEDCDTKPDQLATNAMVACKTTCFTMALQIPSDSGSVGNTRYVRGCYDLLSGRQSLSSTFPKSDSCEWGAERRLTPSGVPTEVNHALYFCTSEGNALCNTHAVANLAARPNDCPQMADADLQSCYQSRDTAKPCKAKWCLTRTVRIEGQQPTTEKACASVNPLAVEGCVEIQDTITAGKPGASAVQYRSTQCFCRAKSECNRQMDGEVPRYCAQLIQFQGRQVPMSQLCAVKQHGDCVDDRLGAKCKCKDGWKGMFCEDPPDSGVTARQVDGNGATGLFFSLKAVIPISALLLTLVLFQFSNL